MPQAYECEYRLSSIELSSYFGIWAWLCILRDHRVHSEITLAKSLESDGPEGVQDGLTSGQGSGLLVVGDVNQLACKGL